MSDIVHKVKRTIFISPTSTRWPSDIEAVRLMLVLGLEKVTVQLRNETERRSYD